MRRAWVRVLALGVSLSMGCTIEGMRNMGEPCQQTRECIMGLQCLPRPDNITVCQQPVQPPPVTEAAVASDATDAPAEGG